MTLWIKVRGKHSRAQSTGKHSMHDTDRSLPDHEHGIVRGQIKHLHAFKNGIDRLDKGCLLKRNSVGDAYHAAVVDDEIHDANVLCKAATRGLKPSRDAHLLIERALRRRALTAVVAVVAWHMVKDHDAFTDFVLCDAFAHGYDHSGHLMPEDARRGVGTCMNLLEVSTADAAGRNLNEQFTATDHRHRNGFDAHVVDAAINHGPHGRRNLRFHQAFRVR